MDYKTTFLLSKWCDVGGSLQHQIAYPSTIFLIGSLLNLSEIPSPPAGMPAYLFPSTVVLVYLACPVDNP